MKKIIFAISFLVFSFYILFSGVSPSLAAGQSCCADKWFYDLGLGQPTCFPTATHVPFTDDPSKIQCDTFTEGCDNLTRTCQPKTKPAVCPNGFTAFPPTILALCPELQGKCCQLKSLGICNTNVFAVIDPTQGGYCANVKRLTTITNGICQPDAKANYAYNPKTNLCEAVAKTAVALCFANKDCETAIGMINTSPVGFIGAILKLVMGVAGGIALLMLIIASYGVLTSSGDPQKLQGAKEMFISVISGIALIAFSMVLLRTIGVDILSLPPLK